MKAEMVGGLRMNLAEGRSSWVAADRQAADLVLTGQDGARAYLSYALNLPDNNNYFRKQ